MAIIQFYNNISLVLVICYIIIIITIIIHVLINFSYYERLFFFIKGTYSPSQTFGLT